MKFTTIPTAHQQQSNKGKLYTVTRKMVKTPEGFVQKTEHADDKRQSIGIITIRNLTVISRTAVKMTLHTHTHTHTHIYIYIKGNSSKHIITL